MFMHTHVLWKQLKCPLTDEWVKKKWCIYAMEYYTAIKKNKISPFAAILMPLEIITLSEVSWTEKDKYYMISHICGVQKAMQINLYIKQKQTHKHRKHYRYQRYKWGGIN